MKIDQLPEWLQRIANIRIKEYPLPVGNTTSLIFAFDWKKTPEGHEFWDNINENKIPDPKDYVKVGDYILITKSGINWASEMDKFVGKTFKVTELIQQRGSTGYWEIKFEEDKSHQWRVEHSHFIKAFPPTQSEEAIGITYKFKIGDKVKITSGRYKDKIGEIEDLLNSDNEYGVRFDKSNYWDRISESNIQLITETKSSQIVVGSKVRLSQKGIDSKRLPMKEGQIGTICNTDDSTIPHQVKWDDGDKNWFSEGILELVPEFGGEYFGKFATENKNNSQSNSKTNVSKSKSSKGDSNTIVIPSIIATITPGSAPRGIVVSRPRKEISLGS